MNNAYTGRVLACQSQVETLFVQQPAAQIGEISNWLADN